MTAASPRIAILGAGPIGLEAALAAAERGHPFSVYEAAQEPAGNVRHWGHVRTFTPWEMNVSERMRAALGRSGAEAPSGGGPATGTDLAERVLDAVAALPHVAPHLHLGTRVVAIGREGLLKHEEIGSAQRATRPFRLLLTTTDGGEALEHADVVVDATGSYANPNLLGDGGIPALGERAFESRIDRFIPDLARDPQRWAGATVLLTGGGHSAQTAARDLAEFARGAPGTRVLWAVRDPNPAWKIAGDPLAERAALNRAARELAAAASPAVETRRGVVTESLAGRDGRIVATLRNGAAEEVVVDRILALNGGVGDASLYRQLQVHECYATLGPMKLAASLMAAGGGADCLSQTGSGPETLVNPEPGFFILGAKSYGRNSQFLLRTGWQQVDDVFGLLAGLAT
jgi:2-polyprenyl-6-methoxyphenol hydroxylase-like FAD-dependent oxidoreductase